MGAIKTPDYMCTCPLGQPPHNRGSMAVSSVWLLPFFWYPLLIGGHEENCCCQCQGATLQSTSFRYHMMSKTD